MTADGRGALARLLFPDPPRGFRCKRALEISLRSLHVLSAGLLVGAFAFGGDAGPWLAATVATGLSIVALDCYESAAFLLQVRGALVLVKVAALVLLPLFHPHEAWVLGGLVLVSVLSSHAPGKVRYFLLVGRGGLVSAGTSG